MSHIEVRREVEEWEVEVCDNCGHDMSSHYPENGQTEESGYRMRGIVWSWKWEGCCAIDTNPETGGRILKATNPNLEKDNPFPRCKCMKFV